MHQNNLVNRINLIFNSLKSKEIIDFLNQWNIDKLKLLTLVIESKIGYDRLISDPECNKFIADIEEHTVYNTGEYSELIMFISTMGDINAKFNNGAAILNKFQYFHKMLFKTGTLVLKLLNDKPVEAIPVQERNSIVNPLFAANQMQPATENMVAPTYAPQQHVQGSVGRNLPQAVQETKVFSIAKHADHVGEEKQEDDSEMSLSNFLKSLATG